MTEKNDVIELFNTVEKDLKEKQKQGIPARHKIAQGFLKHNFMTLTKIMGLSPLVWCEREGLYSRYSLVISPDGRSLEEWWNRITYQYSFHNARKTEKNLKEAIKRHKLNIGEVQARETTYKEELNGLEAAFQEIKGG
jgi:hypothetical protein